MYPLWSTDASQLRGWRLSMHQRSAVVGGSLCTRAVGFWLQGEIATNHYTQSLTCIDTWAMGKKNKRLSLWLAKYVPSHWCPVQWLVRLGVECTEKKYVQVINCTLHALLLILQHRSTLSSLWVLSCTLYWWVIRRFIGSGHNFVGIKIYSQFKLIII